MSADYYYKLCHDHIGQDVEITDRHGKIYTGKIERVDRENVYLRPHDSVPGHGHHHGGPGLFFLPLVAAGLIAIPLIGIAGFRRRPYYY